MGWSDLVKNGCSWTHALTISGIPYVFTEATAGRADGPGPPGVPSGYLAAVPALVIKKGQKVGCKIDRATGFAAGDALAVTLSWDGLDGAGVTGELFQNPTIITKLLADIDETTGNKSFDPITAGPWSAGFGHIGIERVAVATTGTAGLLNLTSRGTVGSQASIYTHRSPTFSLMTDKPRVWRGRDVTLWRCLVTAEGAVIDSTWLNTASTTTRVIWRGYVDSPPRAVTEGMELRCLALVRRAALPIGHDVVASVYQCVNDSGSVDQSLMDAINDFPVYWAPGAVLFTWQWKSAAGGGLTATGTVRLGTDHPDGVMTLGQIGRFAYSTLYSGSSSSVNKVSGAMWDEIASATVVAQGAGSDPDDSDIVPLMSEIVHEYGQPYIRFRFGTYINACNTNESFVHVPAYAAGRPALFGSGYHKMQAFEDVSYQYGGYTSLDGVGVEVKIPIFVDINDCFPGVWLPIVQTEGTQWQDVTFPTSGHGLVEQGGEKQAIRWDQKISGSLLNVNHPGLVMLRVAELVSSPGTAMLPFGGATLKYTTGLRSSVADALLTLLESSGAGNRGTYDTLALAQGAGIHEDQINEPSMLKTGMGVGPMDIFSDGRASIGDLLGGHIALRQLCVVQRCSDPDATGYGAAHPGDCQLALVNAAVPMPDEGAISISISELVLESIDAPEPAEVPNTIEVDQSTLMDSGEASINIQDLPRIQAEGPRPGSHAAPGLPTDVALSLAAAIIAQGDGQMIVTMRIAPWVEIQPGDDVRLTIAHPMIYDYATATRATALVGARCLGWESDLYSGLQRVTLLIAGAAPGLGYLCPSVTVVAKPDSTTITIAANDAQWLTDGDQVLIYNVGEEQNATPETATYTIDTVSATSVTFTGALAAWVDAGSIVTYPAHTAATTRQQRFIHMITVDRWG